MNAGMKEWMNHVVTGLCHPPLSLCILSNQSPQDQPLNYERFLSSHTKPHQAFSFRGAIGHSSSKIRAQVGPLYLNTGVPSINSWFTNWLPLIISCHFNEFALNHGGPRYVGVGIHHPSAKALLSSGDMIYQYLGWGPVMTTKETKSPYWNSFKKPSLETSW